MSDQPSLTFCPTCFGPLSPEAARERLADGQCVGCHVEPPPTAPGELLYCSRTGKELRPEDFSTNAAIRVGKRHFSLASLCDARQRGAQTGHFSCDSCGATLNALDFLSHDAQVIDKVILCPKCIRKNPDPAGNGRVRSNRTSAGGKRTAAESSRERKALKAAKEKTASAASAAGTASGDPSSHRIPDTPLATPTAGMPAAVGGAGDVGGADVGDDLEALDFQPANPSAFPAVHDAGPTGGESADTDEVAAAILALSSSDDGDPSTVGATAAASFAGAGAGMNGPFAAESGASSVVAPPVKSRFAARLAGRPIGTGQALRLPAKLKSVEPRPLEPRPAGPAELAPDRDVRPLAGAMVMMVLILSALLLIVFMQANVRSGDNPETIARLKQMDERFDRLYRDLARFELLHEQVEQRLRQLDAQIRTTDDDDSLRPNHQPTAHQTGPPTTGGAASGAPTGPVIDPAAEGTADPATATPPGPSSPVTPPTARDPDKPLDARIVALSATTPAVRLNAVMDIHKGYVRDAIPHLLDRVASDTDPYVRAFAIKALAGFRAAQARELLHHIIEHESPSIVVDAARDALALLSDH